jgi:hypothetical protein
VTVVLSGRRDGSTHREVATLASLPPELRLIGGLAVMCRVGTPHRTTVDLDAVARDLRSVHPAIARLAVISSGGGQYRMAGDLELDVIDVATMTTDALVAELGGPGHAMTDLELNVVAHCWAHDAATTLDIAAVDDETGAVLARAEHRYVASAEGIVAMKVTTVPLRASSRSEKKASDLYDLGRVLVDGGMARGALRTLPDPLADVVGARLVAWFVDGTGRDRTYRVVRQFDEPRLDLDAVAEQILDLIAPNDAG